MGLTDFVTVTDDDCVMNMKQIFLNFKNQIDANSIICGLGFERNLVPVSAKTSKWYISKEVYSEKHFPSYCYGGMWTLKMPLLKKIVCAAEYTNQNNFHIEDVYINGILRWKMTCAENNVINKAAMNMVFHILQKEPADIERI